MHSVQKISTGKPAVLYTRHEDGGRRVEVLSFGYQVGEAGPIYTSVRSLLDSVAGRGRKNWTFDRYFRLGAWSSRSVVPEASLTEICRRAPTTASEGLTVAPPSTGAVLRPGLTVVPSKGPTGIDLENRADEVRKLLFAGFGTRIFAAGYDPEDVLQEVYRGLLARNAGRCAWDASKSSFGHYVHMVCSCILSNFHRRENRRRQVEQVGLPAADGEDQDVGEVASSDPRMTESVDAEADFLRHLRASGSGPDLGVAIQILPLVHQGLNRIEIAAQLHLPKGTVSRALALLKEQAARWVQ